MVVKIMSIDCTQNKEKATGKSQNISNILSFCFGFIALATTVPPHFSFKKINTLFNAQCARNIALVGKDRMMALLSLLT